MGDYGFAAHVRDEGVRDADGAVGLLVVFEDGEVGASDGETAAVESVDELGFFCAGVFEVDEAGRDEEEEEDQRHHDVIVKAAALVGPPEVAFDDVRHYVGLRFLTLPYTPRSDGVSEEYGESIGYAAALLR